MSETRNESTTSAGKPVVGRTGMSREDMKLIVKKTDFRLWTGLVCLRTEISGGCCESCDEYSRSTKGEEFLDHLQHC
jgi:hypothetical protein